MRSSSSRHHRRAPPERLYTREFGIPTPTGVESRIFVVHAPNAVEGERRATIQALSYAYEHMTPEERRQFEQDLHQLLHEQREFERRRRR